MQKKKNTYKEVFASIGYYGLKELTTIFLNRLIKRSLDIEEIKFKMDEINEDIVLFNSFIIIVEYTTMTFSYVSKSCREVTGYSQDEWIKGGENFFVDNHCPAERTVGKNYLHAILNHQSKCPVNEKSYYNYTTTFRFYHKNGYFFWLNNHLIYYMHDKAGKLLLSISILTDIDKFKSNDNLSLKIIKYNPETGEYIIEQSIDMPPEGLNLLNVTELKILKMLSEGLNNEAISKRLNLSVHTIRDYRKGMLKKTWCSNTVELVYYALRNNLIQKSNIPGI